MKKIILKIDNHTDRMDVVSALSCHGAPDRFRIISLLHPEVGFYERG